MHHEAKAAAPCPNPFLLLYPHLLSHWPTCPLQGPWDELSHRVALAGDMRHKAHEALAKAHHAAGNSENAKASRDAAAACVDDAPENLQGWLGGELAKLDTALLADT